jgi:hypothetical protein
MSAVLTPARPDTRTGARALTAADVGLLTAAALATVAAVIHAFVVPEHMMEAAEGNVPAWLPLAFAASAGVGLLYALSLGWTGFRPGWLGLGLTLNGVMAGAGIVSRTVGLPGADVEGPTAVFLVAIGAELAGAVILAWLLMSPTPNTQPRLARQVSVIVVAVLVLAAIASAVMVPDAIDHAKMLALLLKPSGWLWG